MNKKKTLVSNIAEQLEDMVVEGALSSGEKLPPERVLAERLNISRPSLREAKQLLISKGIFISKHGGGTYVTDNINFMPMNPLIDILKKRSESRYEILELRHALDSEAAYYAALRATETEKKEIQKNFEILQTLHDDPLKYAIADGNFHLSITVASHNVVLLHVVRNMLEVLQHFFDENIAVLFNLKQINTHLTDQHRILKDAVIQGNADEARAAAQQHIEYTSSAMHQAFIDLERNDKSIQNALLLGKKV